MTGTEWDIPMIFRCINVQKLIMRQFFCNSNDVTSMQHYTFQQKEDECLLFTTGTSIIYNMLWSNIQKSYWCLSGHGVVKITDIREQ
jgi:hypothetical protein